MNALFEQVLDEKKANLSIKTPFRELTVLESAQGPWVKIKGREVINLASNNYLGLATHPRIIEAAVKATREWGVGSGAVRTIAGTLAIHQELEKKLAVFKKTESALVFQSDFTCNIGVIESLLDKKDIIISDELNHASIIDGIRLSKADMRIYAHSDVNALEKHLRESQLCRLRLVITDGVFSMDGDIAKLPEITNLCEQYNAILMVDDAHSSGVLGCSGRGSVDHFGLHGRVDIQVGTLSKAIGVLGGYIASSKKLIDYLIHRGRPFLFSTSHPPSVVAANIAALAVIQEENLQGQLWENTRYFKNGLKQLGFNTGNSETPITPVILGSGAMAMAFSDALLEEGVFCTGIGFPTVPEDQSRVRTIVMANHTREDLDQALVAFEKVKSKMCIG